MIKTFKRFDAYHNHLGGIFHERTSVDHTKMVKPKTWNLYQNLEEEYFISYNSVYLEYQRYI